MTEDYCKRWNSEWEKLGKKATKPLEVLEKKKSLISEFYIHLEKEMDISFTANKEIGSKQEGIKKCVVKLQNMVADARQCCMEQRADKMC